MERKRLLGLLSQSASLGSSSSGSLEARTGTTETATVVVVGTSSSSSSSLSSLAPLPATRPAFEEVIYAIALQHGCWYIGRTNNLTRRLDEHANNTTNLWLKRHPPLSPVTASHCLPRTAATQEDAMTLEYMATYGIDKVRGGSFVAADLSDSSRSTLETMLKSARNLCYRCGQPGHQAISCSTSSTNIRTLPPPGPPTTTTASRTLTPPQSSSSSSSSSSSLSTIRPSLPSSRILVPSVKPDQASSSSQSIRTHGHDCTRAVVTEPRPPPSEFIPGTHRYHRVLSTRFGRFVPPPLPLPSRHSLHEDFDSDVSEEEEVVVDAYTRIEDNRKRRRPPQTRSCPGYWNKYGSWGGGGGGKGYSSKGEGGQGYDGHGHGRGYHCKRTVHYCFRCGRVGHYADECYAKTFVR